MRIKDYSKVVFSLWGQHYAVFATFADEELNDPGT